MTAIKIEKKIKIPNKNRTSKYPWAEMKVGDSFLVPRKVNKNISTSALVASKKLKMKFSVRRLENGRYRVWRIK